MEKLQIRELLKRGLSFVIKNPVLFMLGFIANLPLLFVSKELSLASAYGFLAYLLVTPYLFGLIMKFVYESADKEPSWGSINQIVLKKYFFLLFAYIIYYLVMLCGFVLFVIPGIFLSIRLLLCDAGVLFEGESVFVSLRRSWRITRGSWWRMFALVLICYLPVVIFSFLENVLRKEIYLPVNFLITVFACVWYQCIFTLAYLRLRNNN